MRPTFLLAATAGLLLGLAGCAVYVPTVPSTPMVRAAGQADLSAGFYQPGHVEASAVYSPVSYVLLTGLAAGVPRLSGESSLAQYEVGGGLYHPLGEHWVISGVGGYGQAHSRRATTVFGVTALVYEADYHKTFGQLAIARTTNDVSYGLTYRLTNVTFDNIREISDGPISLRSMLRHEVATTLRMPLGSDQRWQVNGSLGLSFTDSYNTDLSSGNGYTHVDVQKNSTLLVGIGLTYLLGKR